MAHTTITTTITSRIDLDSFKPTHSVEIEAEDELPTAIIGAVVSGALRATHKSVNKQYMSGKSRPFDDEDEQS